MGGLESKQTPKSPLVVVDPMFCKTTPDFHTGNSQFPANYGVEEGKQRKEREMIATEAEMHSANVPLEFRDYCAHKFIAFEKCKKDKFPLVYRCHPERHDLEHCQYEDQIIRMKEYERERRLLHRKKRKEEKAERLAAREAAAAAE